MNGELEPRTVTTDQMARLAESVRSRLAGRVQDLQLILRDDGLVLRGRTHTYYAKQLAQQAVLESLDLSIQANEIEVF